MRKKFFILRLFFLVAFLLQANAVFSQDTIPKKDSGEIWISPPRHYPRDFPNIISKVVVIYQPLPPGINTQKPDSILQSRNSTGTMTDLLLQSGTVFLKSYGGGSLATTSVRGANESQTPVMWNGLNLQSPTNGNVDLSLLPVILFDDISIQNGATSSNNGSGAIGGVINVNSNIGFSNGKKWEARYAGLAGSFGEINNGIKIGFSNDNFSADVRAYRQQAKNNFTFQNSALPGNPVDTLKNGDFLQQGIVAEARKQFANRNFISVRSWIQMSDRGIVPSMLESSSEARQADKFFRNMAEWKHFGKNGFTYSAKSALLTEYLNYDIGFNQPLSITNALSLINEASVETKYFHNWFFNSGISDTWAKANVTQNLADKKQDRASVFAGAQYVRGKIFLSIKFREEEVNGKFVPPVGSFGCDYAVFKWMTLKGSVARNYRIPTFNDLYWNPGGNPDLKPEDSWNEEITGDFHFQIKGAQISYVVSGYNRNTNNWIQWVPGPAYWYPENLLSVWSRGVEHHLKAAYGIENWKFTLLAGYEYVRATNEKSNLPNDPTIGKQLMYLPADRWNAMLQIDYRKFYFSFQNQFTDLRFTATDHTSYLPAYAVAQGTIGKRIDTQRILADVFFRVNNVFDKDYQAIAYRAMPGRSFQVGLTIIFKSEKITTL